MTKPVKSTVVIKTTKTKKETSKNKPIKTTSKAKIYVQPTQTFDNNNYSGFGCSGCFGWTIIIIVLLMLIGYLTDGK